MSKAANSKLTASLNRSLQKIAADQFDEYDIKLLLIDVREYLRGETFLREVADFVAHPERERGLCHKAINARYAKIKMAAAGTRKLVESNIIAREPNKPDRFYTDQILSYITLPKIAKADYQLFVLDSLDDLTDEILSTYYKLTKREAHQLLLKSFTKNAGFYCLNPTLNIQEVYRLDDLLKFIRGTVLGHGAIGYEELQREFDRALSRISQDLKLPVFQRKLFQQKFDAVFVCILALMHDAKFKLYDGEEARAYLSLHGSGSAFGSDSSPYTLALMAETPEISFPLITSAIVYSSFIDETGVLPATFELKPIPWVHTRRKDTRLVLERVAVG